MAPAVSILLPFHNAANTLAACLRSLQHQTLADFEVLALDDGSTDEGNAIAEAFARGDARFRLITLPHGGIVTALNRGLELARGRFIARMDADDFATPERLALQKSFMETHPDLDLCGGMALPELPAQGGVRPGVKRYHDWMNSLVTPEEIALNMFVESPIPHPTFFAPARTFKTLQGYRDLNWPEDYDFLQRGVEAGMRYGKVPQVLVRRTDHPARLTRTDSRYRREGMFRAKAHFFARGSWLDGRPGVVLGGGGNTARMAAETLMDEGVPVLAFFDNKDAQHGRRIMGVPAYGFPGEIDPVILQHFPDALFLSCIGEPPGRERLRAWFNANGMREGEDFLAFS